MIKEIRLPEISENVDCGDVIRVLVKVGDFIEVEQSLVEIETEKATFEVPSPLKGKIVEIHVKEAEEVKVGQMLVKIDTEAKAQKQDTTVIEEKKDENKEAAVRTVPASEASTSEQEQPKELYEQKAVAEEITIKKTQEQPAAPSSDGLAAPSERQLARELGIELSQITGTGPGGRISEEDVKEGAKKIISGRIEPATTVARRPLPDFSKWGEIERKKISFTRKKIADTLSFAWSNVPQVTQYDQVDITALEQFRCQYAKTVEEAGGKLTVTSILLKVVTNALKEFPKFNASFDPDGKEIIYKKYCHISVAVETDRGLLVPVIRHADKKSILELSVELKGLSEKTRQHKVTPEDMMGGNITISNLGGIGGTNFAPIIYWPQAAILGVARATAQPVYINGVIERRMILPLSLSYDHRIIDGAEGLRFLRWIAKALEAPFLLALHE